MGFLMCGVCAYMLFRTPTHSHAHEEQRTLRAAQLTSPTNRIRRRPYNHNADGNSNGDEHLPIRFPVLGDIGVVLPVPTVNGVNNDPFLAPVPVGPLTQRLRDMDTQAADNNQSVENIRERLRNISAAPPPRVRGRPRGCGGPSNRGGISVEDVRARLAVLPHPRTPSPPPLPQVDPVPPAELRARHAAISRVVLPLGRRPSVELRNIVERYDLGPMNVVCPFCRALHWEAEKLSRSTGQHVLFGCCCKSGKVELPQLQPPPNYLHHLLTSRNHNPESKAFRDHICQVNSAFAFVSVGVKMDESVVCAAGPYCFKICGNMHHNMGCLQPRDQVPGPATSSFAQIYIHDGDNADAAADRRAQVSHCEHGVFPATWRALLRMLKECNPYINVFRQAHQILSELPPHIQSTVGAALHVDKTKDPRRYNLPSANEVAAIIPSGSNDGSKDLMVFLRGHVPKRIYDTSPLYQPLFYVLLFPRGELGWQPGIKYSDRYQGQAEEVGPNEGGDGGDVNLDRGVGQVNPEEGDPNADHRRATVSRQEYYAYRLHPRQGEAETILLGRKLFQQYIVDAWAITEQQQLEWIRHNQQTLRADQYRGLADAIDRGDNIQNQGTRVILPSSHLNSTRAMYQLFQDSMAIHRQYQHADVFITMTANPNWKEIQDALLPGQTANDRPDLVSRVFELKKRALLDDIKQGVLGKHVAHVYTVEFQKRGFPHMHLIVFFSSEHKIRSADDFKHMVRADIPDRELEPELHNIVSQTMLHDCNQRCQINGRCSKRFPKPFNAVASMSERSYATYCRPDNHRTIVKKVRGVEKTFTNQHVVPYCPYFSLKYWCHINVEVCISVKSIKYIHKYIYKGHDRTTMLLNQGDEVQQYIDARYLAPHECIYRLMAWHLHEELPNVIRLPIPLDGDNVVYYDEDLTAAQLERRAKTHLTAYFEANATDSLARTILYQEFPGRFVWIAKTHRWKPHQRGWVFGRMYTVHPNAREKFYLRLLLTSVQGATSFENLCTVDRVLYPTFKEACLHRGLLEDDNEWRQCLSEAKLFKTCKVICI